MEDVVKTVTDKISSYNILNNLFPGVVFCFTVNKITRFNLVADSLLEQLFVWYFIGMIISRIGSIYVEDGLKKFKIKNKPYLVFADYTQYSAAAEARPFIATLSETNNIYRTVIALLTSVIIMYLYDTFIFDWIERVIPGGNQMMPLIIGVWMVFLFVKSYRKQTDYIRKQVEKYTNEQDKINRQERS